MKFTRITLVVCILLKIHAVRALPLFKVKSSDNIEVVPQDLLSFMRRFGYLDPTPQDAETLYHKTAIIEAIKNVQIYGGMQATGTLDTATMELLNKPRCGVPDIIVRPQYLAARRKRFIIGARPWSKVLVSYFIANNSSLKVPKVPMWQVERDVSKALLQWSRYSGLKFERVNDTSADIIIGFGSRYHGDSYSFDGPGNILAHAFYPYDEGAWGGDVHFDEDENWLENAPNLSSGVDFYAVALHELGHSLGLAHSTIYSSIMFPYYKGPQQTNLDYDDVLAINDVNISKEGSNSLVTIPTTTTTEASTVRSKVMEPIANIERDAAENVTQYFKPSSTTPSVAHTLDLCRGHFDAITVLNGSVHIFKGKYIWQLTQNYTVQRHTPRSILQLFPFLNGSIDAVFVRQDGILVLFTGEVYWLVNGTIPIHRSPLPLKNLFQHDQQITKIDTAMIWPKNNRLYIFAGDQFWRMDELMQNIDYGYPKSIKRWPGIPSHLDAAATLTNGKTYFFKDNLYWLYNNVQVRPEHGYPRRISSAWLHCTSTTTMLRNHNTTVIFPT